jgi:long-chain acyl-CoA synthetase
VSATRTFPGLLKARAAEHPDQIAMQEKQYGVWQSLTWSEYQDRVTRFANGLGSLGVDRGDVVAVLGDNRPEWLIAELASQSVGASVVGVYPTSIHDELLHILRIARVEVVVAEDQEQVDKLIRLKDQLPLLRVVVFYDPHGLERYEQDYLRGFLDVEEAGAAWEQEQPEWLAKRLSAVEPDDIAVICTTSGTTSRPKLAEISHANMLEMAGALAQIDPMSVTDRYVSFLPFAWMGEQMLAVACGMTFGFAISFPEDAETQRTDLREIGPSVMFSPPRIWESMLSDVQVRIGEAGWLKRRVFAWGYGVGERAARRRVNGEPIGARLRLVHLIADQIALRPVRDQLGLARIRRCYTGGAPLGPDLFSFFHSIGVNLKQIYGQTEICGIAVVHRDDAVAFDTVGKPLPGTELKLDEDGQILLRSSAIFAGYHRNSEASREAVDDEGWLHTGDAGYLDDAGQLVVIDRVTDVLKSPDGTQFSAAFVENRIKFSPYVEEAVVFGGPREDGSVRSELGALITLDLAAVSAWAERQHLSFTTYSDIAANEQTYELIATEVGRANAALPESVRVRKFVLLHKAFDPDDDEITRTRKVRRSVIAERYAGLINALDEGADVAPVSSEVVYQDGSVMRREYALRVVRVDPARDELSTRRMAWAGDA